MGGESFTGPGVFRVTPKLTHDMCLLPLDCLRGIHALADLLVRSVAAAKNAAAHLIVDRHLVFRVVIAVDDQLSRP